MNESKRVVGIQAVAEEYQRGKGKWGGGTNCIMYGLLLPISQSLLLKSLLSLATISTSFLECSRRYMTYMLDPNPS